MVQQALGLFGSMTALFLALLFVRAAIHKIGDRNRFRGILAAYGILPERTLTAAALAIVVLELAAAILLIMPEARPLGATLAVALLALYALAMAIALARGHDLMDCGCGESPEPVSWLLVARNAALVAVAASTATGLAGAGASAAENVTALAMAILLFVLWLAAQTMFSNARRIGETLHSATRGSTS